MTTPATSAIAFALCPRFHSGLIKAIVILDDKLNET